MFRSAPARRATHRFHASVLQKTIDQISNGIIPNGTANQGKRANGPHSRVTIANNRGMQTPRTIDSHIRKNKHGAIPKLPIQTMHAITIRHHAHTIKTGTDLVVPPLQERTHTRLQVLGTKSPPGDMTPTGHIQKTLPHVRKDPGIPKDGVALAGEYRPKC
jgi:hypothetical protein